MILLHTRPTLFPYTTLFRSYAGGVLGGNGTIEKWTKDLTTGKYGFSASFTVPVDNSGPGWIDLASDGHTIFYTSQGADRKSTRLNSSHRCISYAVFCLKKKT